MAERIVTANPPPWVRFDPAIETLVVLCKRPKPASVLERVVERVARRRWLRLCTVVHGRDPLPASRGALVLVRSSELPTLELETQHVVYPAERQRHRCRDKAQLHAYCRAQGIATPETFEPAELAEQYVFKRRAGSSGSLVDPFAGLDLVVQRRVAGTVVKCYGHVECERFLGYEEDTRQPVAVPSHVSALCRKVLADHGLVFGGLDFIASDSWQLIDLNATTGFGHAPYEDALPVLSAGVELLLSRASLVPPGSVPCAIAG
ncbi:MAG: hypothetical protein OEZ06_07400 [Myxococcales bacterium]|nr:hypothetical protein [Myxococcales bacterium]